MTMKNKKVIIVFTIVALIVLFAIIIVVINNNDDSVFKDQEEMSEIINGTWQTGNTENDFIIVIDNDNMVMKMGDENRAEESYHINLVPEEGYFYTDTNTNSKYKPILLNGEYIIENGNWTYEKVE